MTIYDKMTSNPKDGFRLNSMYLRPLSQKICLPKTWRYEDEIDYDGDAITLKVLKVRDKHVITKDGM